MPALFESTSSTQTVPSSFNTGFSEVAGPATSVNVNLAGKFKIGKGGTLAPQIYLTDQGAIAAAKAIADQSLHQVELFGGTIQSLLAAAIAGVRGSSTEAIGAVGEANRGEVENISLALVKWGALAIAVYAGTRLLRKGA